MIFLNLVLIAICAIFQEVTPYISAAEMVKKFESGTRELGIPHNRSLSHVSIPFFISVVRCIAFTFLCGQLVP